MERWVQLTEFELDVVDEPVERAPLWLQAAHIRVEHLGAEHEALENLLAALDESPSDVSVRDELIKLGTSLGEWHQLVDAFEAAAVSGDDSEQIVADYMMVAQWCIDHLNEPERAVGHYRRVLDVDDANEVAVRALSLCFRRLTVGQNLRKRS